MKEDKYANSLAKNQVCAILHMRTRYSEKRFTPIFMGYTPTLVSYVIIPSGDGTIDVSFYAQLTTVADFIFSVSLCFNPFIYVFRSTNFKEGFKRVILSRNPQRNNEVAQRDTRAKRLRMRKVSIFNN